MKRKQFLKQINAFSTYLLPYFHASVNRKMIIMAVECNILVNSLSRIQYFYELIFSISQKHSRMFLVYVKKLKSDHHSHGICFS
jgi:hypothetical protein